MGRWRVCAAAWPALCAVFAGIVLSRPGRELEERVAHTAFILFALLFYALGMAIRRRLLAERVRATAQTTAAVVSDGRRVRGGRHVFFPEFAFQAGGRTWRVVSPSGRGRRAVCEGQQVELYYAPEDPRCFYVPAVQRHDRRVSALLCGIGVVWPLLALCAPWLEELLRRLGAF